MAGLLDRLSPREYAGAAIAALLRRDHGDVASDEAHAAAEAMPTAAEIALAFDAGVSKEIDALAGAIVDRAARAAKTEPRSTPELAQGSIELAKRIHKGVDGVLDFVAAVAGPKSLPGGVGKGNGPVKASPGVHGRVAGGTGGGEAVTIDFEPDDGG